MTTEKFANLAVTALVSTIGSGDTSCTIADGANFPSQGNFRIKIDNELILVTAISGNTAPATLTIQRGVEGSTFSSHSAGSSVQHILTAGALEQLKADVTVPVTMIFFAGVSSQGTATPTRVGCRQSTVTQTMTLVVQLEATAGTAHARLWDNTSAGLVAEVNTSNLSPTRLTASGLSIVSGHVYELQVWLVGGSPPTDSAIITYGELS